MKATKCILSLFATCFAVQSFAAPASAQQITLKVSHYITPSHGIQVDFLEPWGQELEKRTNGKVKFEIFAVNSAFGNAARQADQLKAGVTDIAFGLRGIPRGRFERSSVFELPFVVSKASAGSRALWEMYKDGTLAADYEGFKILGLMVHNGSPIHTTNKPIKSLEDFKGLRLRTPSDAVSATLQYLGASPVGLPPAQIYENLQKNVIDGLVTAWDLVGAIKLNEIVKHHTEAGMATAVFYIAMDQKRFDELPADVKKAIEETSGDAWVSKYGPWWDKWDATAKADAQKRGHEIIEVSEEQRRKWRADLKPMIDKYLADLDGKGVKNARQIYEKAVALVEKYEN